MTVIFRCKTAEEWSKSDYILEKGEIGLIDFPDNSRKVVSYTEFYANRQEYFTKPYMIDDIDGFVEAIFGRKLIGYSASIDD